MKHQMSELRDLLVKADIDESRREVTLHVPHIDSALIITYAHRSLPGLCGVQVVKDDNDKDLNWRTPSAPYKRLIECSGALHFVRVVRLYDSEVFTLVLEDPAEELKRRCLETARDVLRELHARGVEARVVGSVARDGPWHRNTDVDVMVTNREMSDHPDVAAVLRLRPWRAPLDVHYASWWKQLDETSSFLVWSSEPGRVVEATWSDGERRHVAPGSPPRCRDLKLQVSCRNVAIETCSDCSMDAMEAIFRAA